MPGFELVTDDMLTAARADRACRRELLTRHLDALIKELNRLRASDRAKDPNVAGQIARGAVMAVRLAEMLQETTD